MHWHDHQVLKGQFFFVISGTLLKTNIHLQVRFFAMIQELNEIQREIFQSPLSLHKNCFYSTSMYRTKAGLVTVATLTAALACRK